jgi:hypothetical protein
MQHRAKCRTDADGDQAPDADLPPLPDAWDALPDLAGHDEESAGASGDEWGQKAVLKVVVEALLALPVDRDAPGGVLSLRAICTVARSLHFLQVCRQPLPGSAQLCPALPNSAQLCPILPNSAQFCPTLGILSPALHNFSQTHLPIRI